MKSMTLLVVLGLSISFGCSKKVHSNNDETSNFTFRAQKNGTSWKAHSLAATYNTKDSMVHI